MLQLISFKYRTRNVMLEQVCSEEGNCVNVDKQMHVHCPDTGLHPHLALNSVFSEQRGG